MPIEFYETKMGRQFFDGTMPELTRQLKRLSDVLEKGFERETQDRVSEIESATLAGLVESQALVELIESKARPNIQNIDGRKIEDLHAWALDYVGDQESVLNWVDDLQYVVGIAAACDWLLGIDSVLTEEVNRLMEDEDAK
jgi:hypothetical protein